MNASRILHYIALILGFQASAFFLFFLISDGVADLFDGKFSVIPILIMMIFTVFGSGKFDYDIRGSRYGTLPYNAWRISWN